MIIAGGTIVAMDNNTVDTAAPSSTHKLTIIADTTDLEAAVARSRDALAALEADFAAGQEHIAAAMNLAKAAAAPADKAPSLSSLQARARCLLGEAMDLLHGSDTDWGGVDHARAHAKDFARTAIDLANAVGVGKVLVVQCPKEALGGRDITDLPDGPIVIDRNPGDASITVIDLAGN